MGFDDTMHTMIESEDGSFTAYSKEYEEHYHSTKDGALKESLQKHVIPALSLLAERKALYILDICFGLGFNTLATLYYIKQKALKHKVHIISPELDADLLRALDQFHYPKEFESLRPVIEALAKKQYYQDDQFEITVVLGDARVYLKACDQRFDIVYQDAFSPASNPILWTKEYFGDIARVIKDTGVLTSYSIALEVRLALYENGFLLYLNEGEGYRTATLASLAPLQGFKTVDMAHKIACNPDRKPLSDAQVLNL